MFKALMGLASMIVLFTVLIGRLFTDMELDTQVGLILTAIFFLSASIDKE